MSPRRSIQNPILDLNQILTDPISIRWLTISKNKVKGIAEDHRFDCLRTLSSSAWKELATCQFENIEIVNFEKFKVK